MGGNDRFGVYDPHKEYEKYYQYSLNGNEDGYYQTYYSGNNKNMR